MGVRRIILIVILFCLIDIVCGSTTGESREGRGGATGGGVRGGVGVGVCVVVVVVCACVRACVSVSERAKARERPWGDEVGGVAVEWRGGQ